MDHRSVFLENIHHAFAQTDGTYKFPNSLEGDLLKRAKKEIEQLLKTIDELSPSNKGTNKLSMLDDLSMLDELPQSKYASFMLGTTKITPHKTSAVTKPKTRKH